MRVIGTYVEAYEAAAGFVWDSMEQIVSTSHLHRFREIRLEIDTFNAAVTVSLLTDIPGNAQSVRYSSTVNTGSAGRRYISLILPSGTSAPVQGRMYRLKLSGSAKFVLYSASIESLAIGTYVEAYAGAAGAVFDSREVDFNLPAVKEAREIELDIEAAGTVTATMIADQSGTLAKTVSGTGRMQVMVPLTINAGTEQFVEGRLLRLILSSASEFTLYGARLKVRAFGEYLTASESAAGALWDSTTVDLGSQTPKQLREVELDITAYGTYTVTIYTDQPGNTMAIRATSSQALTAGRTKILIPLAQGAVPDNYVVGRNVRVTVTSAAAFKLFGARIDARPLGTYVESYEAAAGAVWDSTPLDLGSPDDKYFDQVRFEMDSDGGVNATVYTDLPGESFASRSAAALTTGAVSRRWATMLLPAGTTNSPWSVEGRSIRVVLSSSFGFRIYKAQVRVGRVGRYLAGTATGEQERLATMDFDFASERIKSLKAIEVDLRSEGAVIVTVFTDQAGTTRTVQSSWSTVLSATTGRQTVVLPVTSGIRGKIVRIQVSSASAQRARGRGTVELGRLPDGGLRRSSEVG
jgi:hypothetical protein